MYLKNEKYGFTIVELLIVIIVVAILATISILAYNGIATKAQVSSIELGAEAYYKAIRLYKAEYESFPLENDRDVYVYGGQYRVYGYCLGDKQSYPNPERGCGGWTLGGRPTNIGKYKDADDFNREINKVVDKQRAPWFDCFYVAGNGSCTRGYIFLPGNAEGSSTLDGQRRSFFGYYLPGRKQCNIKGELAKSDKPISSNVVEYKFEYQKDSSNKYTFQNDKFTLCLYAL